MRRALSELDVALQFIADIDELIDACMRGEYLGSTSDWEGEEEGEEQEDV